MKTFGSNFFLLGLVTTFLWFAAFGITNMTEAQTVSTPNSSARPQQTPTPSKPPTTQRSPIPANAQPTPTPPTDDDDGGPIRINTEIVSLNVRVIDRDNKIQNDVKPEEFKVYEDNVLQKVQFVTREDVPVNYGLVIDNSGSLRSQLEKVIDASKIIIDSNKPEDATFIIRFVGSDNINIIQDFTNDKVLLGEQLDQLFTEGGSTAVIDAVKLSTEKAQEYEKSLKQSDRRRRALILVTDGEDRASYYKEAQLFAALREADVQIYTIGFVNELDSEKSLFGKSSKAKAIALLDKMAKETGGKAYYPKSLSELPTIARDISNELRTQYILTYTPSDEKRDGKFHPIRVVIEDKNNRNKRVALTRAGRTAAKN
ncbi:MAG: VWA domain-containing protein [Pyrinomonadaceae bacterium]|nr:VWA domain-containing protein [Pyrinomonadaceae bacterium]